MSGKENDVDRPVRETDNNETVNDESQEGSANFITPQKQKAEKKKKKSKKTSSKKLSPLHSSNMHQIQDQCNHVFQVPHSQKCTSRKGANAHDKKKTRT